jgi:putative dehydrogenase
MVSPRLATTFASGKLASIHTARQVPNAISGPSVYAGAFGTGARVKYVTNLLLTGHTVAAAEAMVLARRSRLDLELVQQALDHSIASSAIWQQRSPVMRQRAWSPAPRPIGTLLPILKQIDQSVTEADMPTPVFLAAKAVFDKAAADGWEEFDVACVHDQLSGESSPGELA